MKIDLNLVAAALKSHGVEPPKIRAILEDLNLEAQPETGEEKSPAVKKQFVILMNGPEIGWVLQIPEDEAPGAIGEKIGVAAIKYNGSRKGRLYPVKTIGEAIEVAAKALKDEEVWVKTRTPVQIIQTDNALHG